MVAIGEARLDNRSEVETLLPRQVRRRTDLEVLRDVVALFGTRAVQRIYGDFAVVIWDGTNHELVALRDAIGVKNLLYSDGSSQIVFGSHLPVVAGGLKERFDLEFIADFLLGGQERPTEHTILATVRRVPAGSVVRCQRGGGPRTERYWSPYDLVRRSDLDWPAAVHAFKGRLAAAVASRTRGQANVWAELSGGVDSSSVVAMAETTADGSKHPHLAGTLTFVDSLGDADETEFSNQVVNAYRLNNEQVCDYWAWREDGEGPPRNAEPHVDYPFFARDRLACTQLRRNGCRVLLTGFGPDHYLCGNLDYLAELVLDGHPISAVRLLAEHAVKARRSAWVLGSRHLLRPFLPAVLKRRFVPSWDGLPTWFRASFARRFDLQGRVAHGPKVTGVTRMFGAEIAYAVASLGNNIVHSPWGEDFEVRHPFLDRSLVEFSLKLPAEALLRPGVTKRILREAMIGILPAVVRSRRGKGGPTARMVWSLNRERGRLDRLLQNPILAELGCVSERGLRDAVERGRRGDATNLKELLSTLSLETWLAVWCGRWSAPS